MQRKNTQREYSQEELLSDLKGLQVRYWEGSYADELLRIFFPIEANVSIDFDLTESK